MASSRRIEKINILMREVIAAILSREFSFAEGVMVTITRVETSEDLHYAHIFISVFASKESQENQDKNVLSQLSGATGMIQRELNRKLRMRPVPKIIFAIDQNEKRRERIEKLLSGA